MPRPRSPAPTDAELRLLRVLWAKRRATVGEVVAAFRAPRRPAYNTVLTLLRIMEQKGYVAHDTRGRAFVYRPLIDPRGVRRRALRHLLARFFDNSPSLLVLNLLEHKAIDPEELRRLKALVDRHGEEAPA